MRQAELAGSNQGGDRSLEELLPLAVREPKHVATKDGGALLALCVHCKHRERLLQTTYYP